MRHLHGFWRTMGNGIYFRGTEEEMPNFEGEQRQYLGTGNIRKGTDEPEEQGNM